MDALTLDQFQVFATVVDEGSFSAAARRLNRAQSAIADYREVPANEEALYIMIMSYDALGMTQLRDDTARVMEKNYPKSEYIARGFKQKESAWWKLW